MDKRYMEKQVVKANFSTVNEKDSPPISKIITFSGG